MNYRDILDAAFAAKEKGQSAADGEINSPSATDNKTGAGVDIEKGPPAITEKAGESTVNKGGRAEVIEKAAEILRRIKRQSSAAGNDLDIARAKELDGLAEVLDGLCEIVINQPEDGYEKDK